MSGGGATGFAHIGVLKALEENDIPIDYITGTSSGALIGGMYACGYSPQEIEQYVLSPEFRLMYEGNVGRSREFLLREGEENASLISFTFSSDSIFSKSLPTNLIRTKLLDYEMMRLMGTTSAATGKNFDNLFVPFRCVASDIVTKTSKVFRSGNLNEAIRASITYPFFLNPIRIDGVLYFDGGLYNNFPSDVMYSNFNPVYIIGSNVSNNAPPPTEDDLLSQLTNMLASHTDFSLPCNEAMLIQPKTTVSTFEFSEIKAAIDSGYNATLAKIDSIKMQVQLRRPQAQLEMRRIEFRKTIPALAVSEVSTIDRKGRDQVFVRKSILKNPAYGPLSESRLERRYFRTYSTPDIDMMYPNLSLSSDTTYKMSIKVRKAKDFKLDVGGLVSSRPVNTGFVGLEYRYLRKFAITAGVNSYFGKFYSSGKAYIDFHFPSIYPVSFTPYIILNRFDYFTSFATFVEDVKPSFLVQYENFVGAKFRQPIFNNSKSTIDYHYMEVRNSYYQTTDFSNKDTADLTRFNGNDVSWTIEQNSMNRKQYATSGSYASAKASYTDGMEHSRSGTTAVDKYDIQKFHSWLTLSGEIHTFPIETTHFKAGIHALATLTTMPLFKNYTATILSMPAFQPLPDMQTYFLPEYRAAQFVGGGFNFIFTFYKNFDLRFDLYYYQPFKQLRQYDDGSFGYSKPFTANSQAASLSAIYHSPVGPIRFSLNYFEQPNKNPLVFQFSYGFVLFNQRALH